MMKAFWGTAICAAAIASVACTIPAPACAQERATSFNIPASSLDQALRAYARATGRQVLYKPEAVRTLRSGGLVGNLDADTALRHLLIGTGLSIGHPSENVFVVSEGASAVTSGRGAIATDPPIQTGDADIVVTGTNIRGGAPVGPVRVISRAAIERSGRATIADIIANEPSNFGGTGNPVASLSGVDQSTLNYSLAPAANLRGLGGGATLTLFDGRRVAGSGGRGDFTDLSAIPSLAVDRVEILTDGASAIYGSDAVAGVVNIILRHKLDGAEFRVRGGFPTQGGARSVLAGFVAGHTWSGGSLLLAYDFEHRDRLSSSDRNYTSTGDLRPSGGTDHRSYYASPGTILVLDPATFSFGPGYRIPTLAAGSRPSGSDFTPGSNLANLFAGADLSPRFDRHSVYVHAEQSVDKLTVFAEARFAKRNFDYQSPASSTAFVVTAANPLYVAVSGEPYQVIAYNFRQDLGVAQVTGQVSALSVVGGLDWKPGGDWEVDGYGSFARERSKELSSHQLNSTALDEALGNLPNDPATGYSANRDGYFDPYGSGSSNTAKTLAFIGSGYARSERRSSVTDTQVKAAGPIFSLPAGAVKLAVGATHRYETFSNAGESFYSGTSPNRSLVRPGSRGVTAEFAELQIPVVSTINSTPFIRTLTVTAAARHEAYTDFGQTTNPKVGISYEPADGLKLQASWGTSFRAPALSEVNDPRRVIGTALQNIEGTYLPVLFVTGGNANLGPEKARTLSIGASVAPAQIAGLHLGVNYFSTRFRDRIAQPALEDVTRALTNPALATYVQLISPGTSATDLAQVNALLAEPGANVGTTPAVRYQAIVDRRFVNTSSLNVSGIDFDINLARDIGANHIDANFTTTWLFHYVQTLTALSIPASRLGTTGNPVDLKMRGQAGWSRGAVSASVSGNYADGYKDDLSVPARAIHAWFTLDATLGYEAVRGIFAGGRLLLSVENLLDAAPPFVDRANGYGFDAANAGPFGRIVALEYRRTF